MTPRQIKDMREACHVLAEHIMRQPTGTNRCDWLKKEFVATLLEKGNIEELAFEYGEAYPYTDVQNPYLVDVLKSYDEEAV